MSSSIELETNWQWLYHRKNEQLEAVEREIPSVGDLSEAQEAKIVEIIADMAGYFRTIGDTIRSTVNPEINARLVEDLRSRTKELYDRLSFESILDVSGADRQQINPSSLIRHVAAERHRFEPAQLVNRVYNALFNNRLANRLRNRLSF